MDTACWIPISDKPYSIQPPGWITKGNKNRFAEGESVVVWNREKRKWVAGEVFNSHPRVRETDWCPGAQWNVAGNAYYGEEILPLDPISMSVCHYRSELRIERPPEAVDPTEAADGPLAGHLDWANYL